MPDTRVIAYDIDPAARANCAKLASQNGVADRIEICEKFDPGMIAELAEKPYLLFFDAEGAEEEFLDPSAPGMDCADILVETHDVFSSGAADRFTAAFEQTHDVERIGRRIMDEALPPGSETWGDLDRMLALWEWRAGPTPWLWMQCKAMR